MNLYFDNAAAMECGGDTLDRFRSLASRLYGNQESPASGTRAAVADAERLLLETFCGSCRNDYRVLFVHTGTDAVSSAFQAVGKFVCKGKIVLSGGEHSCVLSAAERMGADHPRVIAACGPDGIIGSGDLQDAVSPDTAFAALHLVQSETGAVQRPEVFRAVLDRNAPGAALLIDAIQGAGKVPFDFPAVRPDFFTISGQKLGTPGGAALIYRKRYEAVFGKLRFEEHRIGRLPPAFAVLLAETASGWVRNMEERRRDAQTLKTLLLDELTRLVPGKFRVTVRDASPFILHLLLSDGKTAYQGAIVTRALSERGIVTAPGSACNAETDRPSPALTWMKIPARLAYAALRISFSPHNDADGVRALAAA